jgi:hypothetical protein
MPERLPVNRGAGVSGSKLIVTSEERMKPQRHEEHKEKIRKLGAATAPLLFLFDFCFLLCVLCVFVVDYH